jgi:hypothetical protein
VAIRRWSLFVISGAILILAGCGGGTTLNVQNPPAPTTSAVSIAFQPAPPTSVSLAGTAPVTAVVTNDPTNSGVDWVVNCSSPGNCGSVSPQHTASGQATTYSPSAALPSNTLGISIFAFATADHTKNVNSSLTVRAFATFLKAGTYILETTGFDNAGFQYQFAAAIKLDGNGGVIAGGEQTVDFATTNSKGTTTYSSVQDTVAGGNYFIGPDGRGTLTIATSDTSVGQQGVEGFSLVALSTSQALLTRTDNSNLPTPSNQSSVGTMDLQIPGSQTIAGGYALIVRGSDPLNSPIAFGGVINIDGPQSISGTGSKFDEVLGGSGIVTPSSTVSGAVSAPDPLGTVQISVTTTFGPQVFTGYVIDASHLKLIETDGTVGVTAGLAIGQGSLTGTFSTFAGTYTFGLLGQDSSGSQFTTLAAAGSFTAGGSSLTNGSIDEAQSGFQGQVSDGFSATYTVDPSGRVDTNSSFTFANANNGTGPELVFYLTGGGNQVLVLAADTEPALNPSELGVGTGLAYPTTAGGSFAGDYGLSFTQNLNGTEAFSTGQVCVNGSSVTCPVPPGTTGTPDTLSGIVDQTLGFSPLGPNPITDGFQASPTSGRLTGTLSDTNFQSPLSIAIYLIDSNHAYFVETDGGASGANPGFLAFGYFASRTPVCPGCP